MYQRAAHGLESQGDMGRKTDKPGKPKASEYDVTRHISKPVTAMLWGRAGGRCEFAGCNRPLWMSLVTQSEVNVAQKAHIRSFSPYGPAGARVSRKNS